jgi:hypothetical protein
VSERGLAGVTRFVVPADFLLDLRTELQLAGLEAQERFVLMTGRVAEPREFRVLSIWVPAQTATTHERGLSIAVDGSELRRLNVEWAARNERLAIQVHSHPGHPYHSTLDSRYPMVTVEGGLSIVVPLFGFCALTDLTSCATFRVHRGRWHALLPREVDKLVRFV